VDVELIAEAGGEVLVDLAEDPMGEPIESAIAETLAEHSDIITCLQLQWFVPGRHEEPSIVLAMELEPELDTSERRAALSGVWQEISPILRQLERSVEMVDLDAQRPLFGHLVDVATPLYRRAD
jgi:hypothetical protein